MDPSVMEGVLTPQDIFNLKVDTQARWDKISADKNNVAIPAPNFPAYNFDTDPLNKDTQMDIYSGLLSDNPAIKETAKQALNSKIMADNNVKYKTGFQIDTPYDVARKYIKTDFGFDPTRDNEQLIYENTYANQSWMNRAWQNLGKGLGRFSGSVVTKLGQTIGHLGTMVISGIPEVGDLLTGNNNNNWIEAVADNSFSKWFEEGENRLKDEWLPIFKPNDWDQKGFFEKLGSGLFWSDEVADGAAFMGEMIATTWLTGGLGKLAGLGRIGAMGITGTSDLAKFGRAALKFTTGADNLAGVGTWAVSIAGEAAFESSGKYFAIKEQLRKDREEGKNNYSDEKINEIAGDGAAASFKGNLLALGLSTAFENRFIFQPLLRKFKGKSHLVRGTDKVNKPVASNIKVGKGNKTLDELAEATSGRPTYSSKLEGYYNIAKKLKDPQGALRFYGWRGVKGIVAEGFWEENAQLAIERLSQDNSLKFTTFADQYLKQTKQIFTGDDREAETSVGLGGLISLIGGGGTALVTGERKKLKQRTEEMIKNYNLARMQYLGFQNIFKRDAEGNLIKKGDSYEVDPVKVQGLVDGINKHMNAQIELEDVYNPIFRRVLQENLLSSFTAAAKAAGIWDSVADRFEKLGALSPERIHQLGFDATTKENLPDFLKAFQDQGKIYDSVFEARKDVDRPKGVDIKEYNDTNTERKYELYAKRTTAKALGRALNDYTSLGTQQKVEEYDQTKNLEATNSVIQQYNSLQMQLAQMLAFKGTMPKDSKFFDEYFEEEATRMGKEITRIEQSLGDLENRGGLSKIVNSKGFPVLVNMDSYKGFFNEDGSVKADKVKEMGQMFDDQNTDFYRHAELTNSVGQINYIDKMISDTRNGYQNYLDYKKHIKAVKDIDDEVDEQNKPKVETPSPKGKSNKLTDEERKKKRDQAPPKDYDRDTAWVKKGTNATSLYKTPNDNRVSDDLYDYYGIQPMDTGSLKVMVEKMIENPYVHPYIKEALRKFLPHIPNNATVTFDTKQTTAPGFYTAGTNNITIDPELVDSTNMSFEGVMLHEIVHLLTSDELLKEGSFHAIINDLYQKTEAHLRSKGIDTSYYGFTNVHEFLAEAYSNPEFQKELMNAPSTTGLKSLWDDFIAALKAFAEKLGWQVTPSALDDIFVRVEEYLDDTVYNNARNALLEQGLTEEDLAPYSKREIIDLAIAEKLIDISKPQPPAPTNDLTAKIAELKSNLRQFMIDTINEMNVPDNLKQNALGRMNKDNWYEYLTENFKDFSMAFDPETRAVITDTIEEIRKLVETEIKEEDVAKIEAEVAKQFTEEKVSQIAKEINEMIEHNLIPDFYRQRAVEGPMSFLKFIYDQAHSTTTTPTGESVSAKENTVKTFGQPLVDFAEEVFGKPKDNKPEGDGVPFTITTLVRQQLYDLGYSKQDVDAMKPADAQQIIADQRVKKPTSTDPKIIAIELERKKVLDSIEEITDPKDPFHPLGTWVADQAAFTAPTKEKLIADINAYYDKMIAGLKPKGPIINTIVTPKLSDESIKLLEEAYDLRERALREIKTYEELLRELGFFQNENRIDKAVDQGKMDGNITMPTQKPNEITAEGLNVTDNNSRIARFAFLQKLADDYYKKEDLKLVLYVETGKKGKKTLKGRVADKKGNILKFDVNGEIVSTGTDIIFDLDSISYNTISLPKERAVAAGVKIDPEERYVKNWKLDASFKDSRGFPLMDADIMIRDMVETSKNPILASINFVTQGQLLRPGITNDPRSLTDLSGPRKTLSQLMDEGAVYKNHRGSIAPENLTQNSTFIKSGRLNVRLKRNLNDENDGFEIVEFIPKKVGELKNKGQSIESILMPLFERAVKGELGAEYELFMKKILNRKQFLILQLGTSLLITNRAKFTRLLGTIEAATSADLLADAITSLTPASELMESEFNIDKELYETVTNFKDIAVQYPPDVEGIIANYPDFVAENVTSSAKPAKYAENKEGYVRVNKRLVVTLDSNMADMKNEELKRKQEAEAGTSITPADEVSTGNMMKDKEDTDDDIDQYLDDLKDENCT